jgi:hypothetical protein
MTTAEELWNDPYFIKKRIKQQRRYIMLYTIRKFNTDAERFNEVLRSAQLIQDRFEKRLKELT